MGDKRLNYWTFLELGETEFQWEQQYHLNKERRLWLEGRGYGVLRGLLPRATTPAGLDVVIPAGFGIAPGGEELLVDADQTVSLNAFVPTSGTQLVYIVAEFQELGGDPKFVDELNQTKNSTYEDSVLLQAQTSAPTGTQIELGRVVLAAGTTAVTDAADPDNPGNNEIDLRYATRLPTPAREVVIPLWQDEAGASSTAEATLTSSRFRLYPDRYLPVNSVELEVVAQVGAAGDTGEVRVVDAATAQVLWSTQVTETTPTLVRAPQVTGFPLGQKDLEVRYLTISGTSAITVYAVRLVFVQ